MGTDSVDGPSASGDGAPSEDSRGQAADARDRAADERERIADAREAAADEREAVADAREAAADEREAVANEWQDRLAAWEKHLDLRRRRAGEPAPTMRERADEQIARSHRLLASSQERLERSEAALRRSERLDLGEQEAISREIRATLAQSVTRAPAALQVLRTRADRLRKQATLAAEALAQSEDALARELERRGRVQQATTHQHRADRARAAAVEVRGPEKAESSENGNGNSARSH
ncbi:hypothetical protein ABZ930_33715 [Streptomyces sp. NPDC046716]|uniref:hypothetical protein n=1 Tax=Streptomyces sp. NPDC046716 TaxID=3157093 RepID=UPI003403ABBB